MYTRSTSVRRLWQLDCETRALAQLALRADAAIVCTDDLFSDRQAHAQPGITTIGIEPLVDPKHPLDVIRLEADTVVTQLILHPVASGRQFTRQLDTNRTVGSAELECVVDHTLQGSRQLLGLSDEGWQCADTQVNGPERELVL